MCVPFRWLCQSILGVGESLGEGLGGAWVASLTLAALLVITWLSELLRGCGD